MTAGAGCSFSTCAAAPCAFVPDASPGYSQMRPSIRGRKVRAPPSIMDGVSARHERLLRLIEAERRKEEMFAFPRPLM